MELIRRILITWENSHHLNVWTSSDNVKRISFSSLLRLKGSKEATRWTVQKMWSLVPRVSPVPERPWERGWCVLIMEVSVRRGLTWTNHARGRQRERWQTKVWMRKHHWLCQRIYTLLSTFFLRTTNGNDKIQDFTENRRTYDRIFYI